MKQLDMRLTPNNQEDCLMCKEIESPKQFVEILNAINHCEKHESIAILIEQERRVEIWDQTNGFCHICGQKVALESMVAEHYGGDHLPLAAHAPCCKVREGLSSSEIAIACEIGYWMMMDVQVQNKGYDKYKKFKQPWREEFEEEFVLECGIKAEELLEQIAPAHQQRPYLIDSRENLINSIRRMYINDREAPKYSHWDTKVLEWDEEESWQSYTHRLMNKEDGFYIQFKEQREIDKKKRGKVKQSWKPEVWQRTNGHCHFCRKELDQNDWAMDHIAHHSKGGCAAIWNLVPVHHYCNGYRSAYPGSELIMSFLMGRFIIEQIRKPATLNNLEIGLLNYIVERKIYQQKKRTKRK